MHTVVIGHDYREQEAYDVCAWSLRQRAAAPVRVVRLQERDLRRTGLYTRPFRVDEGGQFWDERDARPFSVAFSFARFLTPLIARAEGQSRGWALFVDCDFLFLRDVGELFACADPAKAVMVVKHNHQPANARKMDGVSQSTYNRKNWSSCVLWNLDHEANDALTPRMVNTMPGSWLHGFQWLPDDAIGELPEKWNWLVGHSPTTTGGHMNPEEVGALHFTDGGPWFPDWETASVPSRLWLDARARLRASAVAADASSPAWACAS